MKNNSGYLVSKYTAIGTLLEYPLIGEACRKSNATLLSSAVVERLFSVAAQIQTARRCRMAFQNKKLSYRRETARQLHTTTWAGQLTF